ncbi:SIMPL domain-containing protein [Pacificimonas sp. WHA3]|uniref:SIMPL domain-containing protein n=1 Tax=Pacificimonas pallii TaxID=2827236 RepID=A0ABS6SCL4_9SPHN|nr:SIMPL domain-containing protein [Pacificimonas pallii]MBV7255975.1 SIMPL domain-containing protein [Pacificimonas pallii]
MKPTLLLAAMAVSLVAMPAAAQDERVMTTQMANATLLTISATGISRSAPDIANVSAGVVTQAETADDAMRQNRERMERVVSALRSAGIKREDIQTSNLNLSPQYRYGENQPPRLTGYQVQNMVSVTLRDIGDAGSVLDALVSQGANQINGPSFSIEDSEGAMNDARRDAMAKARERADIYAGAAGMSVARIVSISEGGHHSPPPMPMMRAMSDVAEDMSTPVEPGQLGLNANVTVVYELK